MLCENESIFPKLYEPFRGDINVEVDLSNYATRMQQVYINLLLKQLI